jgi:hypothetical protein
MDFFPTAERGVDGVSLPFLTLFIFKSMLCSFILLKLINEAIYSAMK